MYSTSLSVSPERSNCTPKPGSRGENSHRDVHENTPLEQERFTVQVAKLYFYHRIDRNIGVTMKKAAARPKVEDIAELPFSIAQSGIGLLPRPGLAYPFVHC